MNADDSLTYVQHLAAEGHARACAEAIRAETPRVVAHPMWVGMWAAARILDRRADTHLAAAQQLLQEER